jgi:hypothetical protein
MNNELINLVDLKSQIALLSGYEFEIANGFWDDVSYLQFVRGKTVIKITIEENSNRILVEYLNDICGISISNKTAEETANTVKHLLEESL